MQHANRIGISARAGMARLTGTVALLGLLLAFAGCAQHRCDHGGCAHGYSDDRDVIQMVSTNVQGKNVYIPGTLVVPASRPTVLSIYNTTETPHGFWIRGIGVKEILMNGQETRIELPALEGGHIYKIECQLHPPHRHATLIVTHGRATTP